jgi:hypothetical protein
MFLPAASGNETGREWESVKTAILSATKTKTIMKIMNIRYFYRKTIYALFVMLLIPAACTDRIIEEDDGGESNERVPIVLNLKGLFGEENTPSTYGLTDVSDEPGTGDENKVDDITVFIFNASTNACDTIIIGTSSPIGPKLVRSGNKKIIAVVNGTNKFPSFPSPGQEGSINYYSLRNMLTKPIDTLPDAPFLMTNEVNAVLQTNQPEGTPNQVNIEVKRAVAKVKIFVTKEKKAEAHILTLKKITLHQGARQVSVISNSNSATILYDVESEKDVFDPASGVIPKKSPDTYCQLADTFYVYETLAGNDKSKAVYFDFDIAVNSDANVRTARVYLAENPIDNTTDTIYNAYRNYWYNIYVNVVDPGMDSVNVTIITSPWNVEPVQNVTEGDGFYAETASPFKLVKYYDADEWNADSAVAAINKHSKGASWIDLKVTPGTAWRLEPVAGGANTGAKLSADTGKTWNESLAGTGTNELRRIHIYRPYVENNEPKAGPSYSLHVDGVHVRTFTVQPRDSLIFPTNSYVMRPYGFNQPGGSGRSEAFIPLSHVYDFWEDFILANGDTIPAGAPTVSILWQDDPGDGVVQSNPVIINPDDRKSSYIRAETGSVQGNAVLNFSVGNEVCWSFHIWNTEYSPYEPAGQILYKTVFFVNNVFMDRNLGAMDTLYTPTNSAWGLYYQFGRKDPFRATDYTLSDQPADGAAAYKRERKAIRVILNSPNMFYRTPFTKHNIEYNGYLWITKGGNKTAFDPCPEGYRVPQQTQPGESYSPWHLSGFSAGTDKFQGGYYSSVLRYYPGSHLNDYTLEGSYAYYWTTYIPAPGQETAIGMQLGTVNNYVAAINNATGAYVRCVVDKNYILKKGTAFGRYTGDIINDLQ